MLRQIIAILLVWSCGMAALHAANGITVRGADNAVGSEVEISVDLTTDAADVVAAEIHIPLPEGTIPVAGSCTKVASRLPDHSVGGNLKGNEYVIVIHNTNLRPIPAGTGKAVSFRVVLGENPGVFSLTPRVKFSDSKGKALQASADGESLTVRGARLELGDTDIDFGRVPIRGTYTRTVTATNTGTADLEFDQFTTDVPGMTVTAAKPTLTAGERTTLTLTYKPVDRAASISGRFTALSNAVGRAPFVRITSVPFSVNELHVGSAGGVSDSEVTIALEMDNMEPIVGAEVTFQLPEGLEYVDGSIAPSARASGLSASAYYSPDRKLRLLLYNIVNKAVSGNEGELMTFKLKLTGRSGSYYLNPTNVILGNVDMENMVSATSSGSVTIQSPSLRSENLLDIGNVPLSGTNTFDYVVSNRSSSVPLTIEKVVFLNDVAECKTAMPIIVEAGASGVIPVTITNPEFGEFETTMNVYTNDPDNRLKAVSVKGNFYSSNELLLESSVSAGKCALTVSLSNEAEIAALQCDIVMPEGFMLPESALKLLERAESHSATLKNVGDNRYRILLYSSNNASFTGNSGGLFSLSFDVPGSEDEQLSIENIKLSSTDGKDFTNPDKKSLTHTISSITVEPFDPFDINTDGVVNVTDVVLLVDKILKVTYEVNRHDLNSDGSVNVSDIVLLVARILHGK